ncbi:hypothetical protein D3C85_1935910 [compost metagenome]
MSTVLSGSAVPDSEVPSVGLINGTAGATVSTVKSRLLDAAELLPAASLMTATTV